MFGTESLTGVTHAAATVGVVLGEAALLYVGYGLLTRAVGPAVTESIEGK